jgi:deoxyribonuclease V
MHINYRHNWDVNIDQALQLQRDLAKEVIKDNYLSSLKLVAGVDVSVNALSEATAVVIVLDYPELTIREKSVVKGRVEFPYIPGLLSFREVPLTLKACEKLKLRPDLVMVDGQGIAHPRGIGLASHLGLFLEIPSIGCAKSSLYGYYQEPDKTAGSYSLIMDKQGNTLGAVLRTKSNVKPLFISIGHKIDLPSAINWVIQCCRGYRLPEPTRLAHLASKGEI